MAYQAKENVPAGVRRYMQANGRRGGSVSSPAKRESAARALAVRLAKLKAGKQAQIEAAAIGTG